MGRITRTELFWEIALAICNRRPRTGRGSCPDPRKQTVTTKASLNTGNPLPTWSEVDYYLEGQYMVMTANGKGQVVLLWPGGCRHCPRTYGF